VTSILELAFSEVKRQFLLSRLRQKKDMGSKDPNIIRSKPSPDHPWRVLGTFRTHRGKVTNDKIADIFTGIFPGQQQHSRTIPLGGDGLHFDSLVPVKRSLAFSRKLLLPGGARILVCQKGLHGAVGTI
jgi:hypothetical protein